MCSSESPKSFQNVIRCSLCVPKFSPLVKLEWGSFFQSLGAKALVVTYHVRMVNLVLNSCNVTSWYLRCSVPCDRSASSLVVDYFRVSDWYSRCCIGEHCPGKTQPCDRGDQYNEYCLLSASPHAECLPGGLYNLLIQHPSETRRNLFPSTGLEKTASHHVITQSGSTSHHFQRY